DPFMIKTTRPAVRLRDEANVKLTRLMSMLSVNGFMLSADRLSDDWFEDQPEAAELASWLNQLSIKFNKPFVSDINKDTAKPVNLATILAGFLFTAEEADALLSDSDINYHLSFD